MTGYRVGRQAGPARQLSSTTGRQGRMVRRFIAAPPGLWEQIERFADQWEHSGGHEDRGMNLNAAVRHLVAVGLTAEAAMHGWLTREIRDEAVALVEGDEPVAVERPELRWGLQPVPAAHAAWGCRAGYQAGELRRPAVQRADMWGSRAGRLRLQRLLAERLPWVELEAQVARIPAGKVAVVYEDPDMRVEARVYLDVEHGQAAVVTASMLTPVPWAERRR